MTGDVVPRIYIGLALYQGGRHIEAQLDSIAAQSFRDWRLVVSDDGSRDDGPEKLRKFASGFAPGQVTLVDGPRAGSTRNFLSLIGQLRDGEHMAFADQDDVWLPSKLDMGLAALRDAPQTGLYSARTTICDADLNPITGSQRFAGPFGFRNALVQAVTGGNTCLLTPDAAQLAKRAAPAAAAAGIEAHDWWLYQLVSGAGMAVLRDDAEVLLYRQHGGNLKGRNDTFGAMRARLGQLFDGNFGKWLQANNLALRQEAGLLSAENRDILARFDRALTRPGWRMAAEFARLGIRRQTPAGTAALYAAALSGRLRKTGD
ncbi:Glycosyltransferase involved in cell wall bisynthesis [Paracoccus isoporae]|uniref:Glycosyltransferase involved in cell wall bisynthesis n=1 Tax=Paracoccus isoporae TaxID=591205 RepID=A0A1G7CXL1_9RHOB|nr:glycosyltransferase [Paracoccus isoporae]SDE43406.1 Glycosyltransferase involved in cell wall bisynthesis [Paracoccus isoporae]